MYKSKLEELLNFLELLRCKSYDDVYKLKKRVGTKIFEKLEERFELLHEEDNKIIGSELEVFEQERTIDFSKLTKDYEIEELYFILKVILSVNIEELKKLKIPTENHYLVQIYKDYINFFKSENIKKCPILLNIKLTSFI